MEAKDREINLELAARLQEKWANEASSAGAPVLDSGDLEGTRLVAGVDVAYAALGGGREVGYACAVAWDVAGRRVVNASVVKAFPRFPYVAGFLGCREAAPCVRAVGLLPRKPDALLVDGHGSDHPRRFGSAVHVGFLAGVPSVGVAKAPFHGVCRLRDVADEAGASAPVLDPVTGEVLGRAVRTGRGRRPLFVSPGTAVTIEFAVGLVLRTSEEHRLPEPLFLADKLGKLARSLRWPSW